MLNSFWRGKRKFSFSSIVILIFAILVLSAVRGKVLFNVELGSHDFGGLAREELAPLVEKKISDYESAPIKIVYKAENGETFTVVTTLPEVGVKFDAELTANRVFNTGRNDNLAVDATSFIRRLVKPEAVEPAYSVDAFQLSSFIDSNFSNVQKTGLETSVGHVGGKFVVVGGESSLLLDKPLFVQDLKERLLNFSNNTIAVSLVESTPLISESGAEKALKRVEELNGKNISLSYDRQVWSLTSNELLNVLEFYPSNHKGGYLESLSLGNRKVAVTSFDFNGKPREELELSLNDKYIEEFVGVIANAIDKNKVDATLVFDGEKVSNFTPATDGRKLDHEQTKAIILEKVSVGGDPLDKSISIALPVNVTKAEIRNEEIKSLGIKELIGRGVSYFRGSIPNRVYNLSLGSSRMNGTLVKPGEVFSFNNAVGEVSDGTGYREAYVISAGRTTLDDGGGICQVSTTVFRAALDSGLPIVSRTAHSYRVSYYEQGGFMPGLDATVWAPAVDFKFRNDTGNHILVQSTVDPSDSKLEVNIYGTGDGRRVEMSNPVLSNVKPALPDRYEEDPTLPSGTVKQVDFAASGATAVFGRKVYKAGEAIIDEVFKSNFRPWQAVYLVGTAG